MVILLFSRVYYSHCNRIYDNNRVRINQRDAIGLITLCDALATDADAFIIRIEFAKFPFKLPLANVAWFALIE